MNSMDYSLSLGEFQKIEDLSKREFYLKKYRNCLLELDNNRISKRVLQ